MPYEQIVKVMDTAKKVGKIGFGVNKVEDKRMESGSEQMRRGED